MEKKRKEEEGPGPLVQKNTIEIIVSNQPENTIELDDKKKCRRRYNNDKINKFN